MKQVPLRRPSTPTRQRASNKRKALGVVKVHGRRVPDFGDELVLIRTSRFKRASRTTKRSEEARVLARRAGEALEKPGISESSRQKRALYSVDPANLDRIIRRSANGKTSVGRLVRYQFRADD